MTCTAQSLLDSATCLSCIPFWMLPAVKTWLVCQLVNRPTVNCEPQATNYLNDWLVRVAANQTAAGVVPEVPNATNQGAIHDFLCTLIQNGIDAKIISMCCFPGPKSWPVVHDADYIAAATPVLLTRGNDPWQYFSSDGTPLGPGTFDFSFVFQPEGLYNFSLVGPDEGWLETGVRMSGGDVNDSGLTAHVGVYPPTAFGSYTMGARDSGDPGVESSLIMYYNLPPFRRFFTSWDASAVSGPGRISVVVGAEPAQCFLSGSRRAANDFSLYRGFGGTLFVLGNAATIGGTMPTLNDIWVYCLNDDGSANSIGTFTLGFAAIHQGLTESETRILYAAVNTMRTAMGGGAV